jgi:hypothetical protein
MYNHTIHSKKFGSHVVLVDDVDSHHLVGVVWSVQLYRNGKVQGVTKSIYDGTHADGRARNRSIALHREILGLKKHDGTVVDHRNGNPLDNRRENLRIGTHGTNAKNQAKRIMKTNLPWCEHPGVNYYRPTSTWRASISINSTKTHLGTFLTMEEAITARKSAEREHYGEFAFSNRLLTSTN